MTQPSGHLRRLRDLRDLASRGAERGPVELIQQARLARRKKASSRHFLQPDGITPLAPLGFTQTLRAIRAHYLLDVHEPVPWAEQDLQRDLARVAAMRRKPEGAHTTVVVWGGSETRDRLACIESVLSWPDSCCVHLVLVRSSADREAPRVAAALGAALIPSEPASGSWWSQVLQLALANGSRQIAVVSAKALVWPGWLDAMRFQLSRPDVGAVSARTIDAKPPRRSVSRNREPDFTQDTSRVASAWAGTVTTWEALQRGGFDPSIERTHIELPAAISAHGLRIRTAYDCFISVPRSPGAAHTDRKTSARKRFVIAADVPWPDAHSGSEDIYWLVRHLIDLGIDVTFAAWGTENGDEYEWALRRLGAQLIFLNDHHDGLRLLAAVRDSDGLIAINGPPFAESLRAAREQTGSTSPLTYVPLDLRNPAQAVAEAAPYSGDLAQRFLDDSHAAEMTAIGGADFAGVISLAELEYLRESQVQAIPFLLPMLRFSPDRRFVADAEPGAVAFVGSFKHPPNTVSAEWFIHEVWPAVIGSVSGAQLRIYGSELPAPLAEKWSALPGVTVVGRYINPAQPYRECSVAVAPLLVGGGINGKVVTALGHGTPVVGTSVAANGLPDDVKACVQTADDAGSMAQLLTQLLADDQAREALSRASVLAYDRHYSETAGRQAVSELIARIEDRATASGRR